MITPKKSIWVLALGLAIASSTIDGLAPSKAQNKPDDQNIYKGSEVDQKARVTKKPEPKYTRTARKHQIEGTVVIRCVFASTEQITNLHIVSGLPDGLTESAVEAAKKIKFIPAMKDGHPVSMWMELQYNFHLY